MSIVNEYPNLQNNNNPYSQVFLSMVMIVLIYGLPVFLAYIISVLLEPIVSLYIIQPAELLVSPAPLFFQSFIVGDYGILSLGMFSFFWAFPVVILVGISIAVTQESNLKERAVFSLDPILRKAGLTGQSIIPVLTGYGCNVVAVFQSRACHACTRKQCISMISFGSACSYQIGATLSIFNVANQPWLFLPYIIILFIMGAVHTRLWYGKTEKLSVGFLKNRGLRKPGAGPIFNRLKSTIQQFFYQAMPIFLLICIAAFLLDEIGVMSFLIKVSEPVFSMLSLPMEAGAGLFFSILRKDGILLFNQGGGSLLASLSAGEIFVLVYLASTLSGCLVTIWTIGKEIGIQHALRHVYKQAITAVVSALALLYLLRGIEFLLGMI